MATAKVDTSAYALQFDFEELDVDQFVEMAELFHGLNSKDPVVSLGAMIRVREALAPFVQRKDEQPLAEKEGARFIGALKIKQLMQVLSDFGKNAIPPQSGSAS